jgi:peptidoglycan hydrolase-like protein with peptidoglycan-binding domain
MQEIKYVQWRARSTTDRIFDFATLAAVNIFQRMHNLYSDGIIGPH